MEKLQFMSQPGNVSELPWKGLSKLTRAQVLLRYVDDYCFVTADLNSAKRFLVTMTNGNVAS